jgi:hypothetical protein
VSAEIDRLHKELPDNADAALAAVMRELVTLQPKLMQVIWERTDKC